ncbi:MAG: hypothetical protein ACXWWV_06290 [Candidatus Deferrimicrobiaceae bacterium]
MRGRPAAFRRSNRRRAGLHVSMGPEAMRGVPQSGLWSEAKIASSGTGSERA